MKRIFIRISILFVGLFFYLQEAKAQFRTDAQNLVLTREDSLHKGFGNESKTVISGYGDAIYQKNSTLNQARASLERAVLFVGHQFNRKISFFSEMELENALVVGGQQKGEISMEQAFLKYNLNPRQYLVAGLFIPRIGILNENHLPVNYNGVERPLVETFVIPSTWRELGIGFYGSHRNINYTFALLNGLNSATLKHGTGIIDGRFEGSNANANNIAVTASIQIKKGDFKFQVSQYLSGTIGLSKRGADSLGLAHGMFAAPLLLSEGNIQYQHEAFSAKALYARIQYLSAESINSAYASNIPETMYGAYIELAYDLLHHLKDKGVLNIFTRYEQLNLNQSIPSNGIIDPTLNQKHWLVGLNYMPIPNIAIKADFRLRNTGNQNSALFINPPPNALPYQQQQNIFNLGIGYSF